MPLESLKHRDPRRFGRSRAESLMKWSPANIVVDQNYEVASG